MYREMLFYKHLNIKYLYRFVRGYMKNIFTDNSTFNTTEWI